MRLNQAGVTIGIPPMIGSSIPNSPFKLTYSLQTGLKCALPGPPGPGNLNNQEGRSPLASLLLQGLFCVTLAFLWTLWQSMESPYVRA